MLRKSYSLFRLCFLLPLAWLNLYQSQIIHKYSKFHEINLDDPVIKIVAQRYMDYYRELFFDNSFLVAKDESIVKAMEMNVSIDMSVAEDHDFDGIDIPVEKIKRENGLTFVFSILLGIKFNSGLYQYSLPFLQTITTQIICPHTTVNNTNANQCEMMGYHIPDRETVKSKAEAEKVVTNTTLINISKTLKKLHPLMDTSFKVLKTEYQQITKGDGRMLYLEFEPMEENLVSPKKCLAAIYSTKKESKIDFIDGSCFQENLHASAVNASFHAKPMFTASTTLILACAMVSLLFMVYHLGRMAEKNEYFKVPSKEALSTSKGNVTNMDSKETSLEIEKSYQTC